MSLDFTRAPPLLESCAYLAENRHAERRKLVERIIEVVKKARLLQRGGVAFADVNGVSSPVVTT